MTRSEIASIEDAGRSAWGWSPEGADGRIHYSAVIAALVPAVGILAVAVTMLLGVL